MLLNVVNMLVLLFLFFFCFFLCCFLGVQFSLLFNYNSGGIVMCQIRQQEVQPLDSALDKCHWLTTSSKQNRSKSCADWTCRKSIQVYHSAQEHPSLQKAVIWSTLAELVLRMQFLFVKAWCSMFADHPVIKC